MDRELEESFDEVERMILDNVKDEKLQQVCIVMNDMTRGTARLVELGFALPQTLDLQMGHTKCLVTMIMAIDQGIPFKQIREAIPNGATEAVMVALLGGQN
jgi:benzoyl-CoA reductase/2-hydroxyglutaryl-CoA dehydratase subunit BcrC/BadD/HgdB